MHTGRKWNQLALCWGFWWYSLLQFFCVCLRKILYVALMALNEILQVYRMDATPQPCTTPDQHILTLLPLPSISEEQEYMPKSIMANSHFCHVDSFHCRYCHMHLEKVQIQLIIDGSIFPIVSDFKMVIRDGISIFLSFQSMHFKGNLGTFQMFFISLS